MFVAIEAKVGAMLDGAQLVRHAADWKISEPGEPGSDGLPAEWLLATWADCYRWARALDARDDLSPVGRFLLASSPSTWR